MDWTDRHCRYFWRLLSRRARLYTEMVTTGALLYGDIGRHLDFSPSEQPVALQLGGAVPQELASAARLGQQWGYQEINLNCGCPSDRVQNGRFGACLMSEPQLVRDCLKAMQDAVSIPVTIKHRTGIDQQNDYNVLRDFVGVVSDSGCEVFIVHARNAWLQGLSPKENREVPPLHYDWVYRLKQDFPDLTIVLNGGLTSLAECEGPLAHVDGVMLGRAPYQNPWLLAAVDHALFDDEASHRTRSDVLGDLIPYIEAMCESGARLHHITRHVLGLFQGQPGGRQFRRHLSENAHRPEADSDTLRAAIALTQRSQQVA